MHIVAVSAAEREPTCKGAKDPKTIYGLIRQFIPVGQNSTQNPGQIGV